MPTNALTDNEVSPDAGLFWWRHRGEIIAALVVFILAALGYTGYRLYHQHRDDAAAQMLSAAKTAPDYQRLISDYPDAGASASAYLLLAQAQRRDGKFPDANATLKNFIEKFPNHELVSVAFSDMAMNFESLGNEPEALATLQRLVATYPHSFNAPDAMLTEVRLLKAQKRIEEARHVCEDLMTRYRDSYAAQDAAQQLRTLKPSTAPTSLPSPAPTAGTVPGAALPQNPAPTMSPR